MSNFGSLKERRRSKFNFFGGRMIAVVVVTAVAALSFSLGYKVGHSGLEDPGMRDAVNVVPEGAGLVLLGGGNECGENAGSGPVGAESGGISASGAVLETMKAPSLPQPDPVSTGAGPDEPVLEPLRDRNAAEKPRAERSKGDRRVAPLRQLPAKQADAGPGSAEAEDSREEASTPAAPEKTLEKISEREKAPVVSKKPAVEKKTVARKRPAASSDGRTYSVQVGAFSSLSDAQKQRLRFTQKGYKASVSKDRGAGGRDIFKVRIGVFLARGEADKMAQKLKDAEGVNAFVTAIE